MNGVGLEPGGSTGSSPATLRSRRYRPDVDGLRSLAILSVVLYHAGIPWLSGGFTGVDVFFVISGYLIGGHITSELNAGVFSFGSFFRNRAKRILPALYLVLVMVLGLGFVLLSPFELRELAKYTVATTASASNIMYWRTTGYFGPEVSQSPLLMTWSLGVEEQFYLVVPLLLALLAKLRRQLILPVLAAVSLLSFFMSVYQVMHSPQSGFYLLTSRAWELGAGVVLAIYELQRKETAKPGINLVTEVSAWLGLLLVLTPFVVWKQSMPFPGAAALPTVLGTCILLRAGSSWINRSFLSVRPLVFIGRISYSFYLFHWPMLSLVHILAGKPLPTKWSLSVLAASFVLAALSYAFVEKPFRRSTLAPVPLLQRYAAASAVLLLVAAGVYSLRGIPKRYPNAAQIDAATIADSPSHDRCLVGAGVNAPNLAAECAGTRTQDSQVALWGDSHAAALAGQLRDLAKAQGDFLEEFAKTSCPPLYGVGRSYQSEPTALRDCIQFNDTVFHRLLAEPNVKTVVLEAYWDGAFNPTAVGQGKLASLSQSHEQDPTPEEAQALLRSSLSSTITALVEAKKRVIVIGDNPVFEINPVWRMRTHAVPLRFTLSQWINGAGTSIDPGLDYAVDDTPQQKAGRRVLEQTTVSMSGATYVDIRARLCTAPGLCAYRFGEAPLFGDTNHLSSYGAAYVLSGLHFTDDVP